MACKEKERENSKVSVLDLLVAHTKKTDVSLVDGVVPDTVLIVETESFLVNRKKLADFSPYFRAMFYGGGKESTKRQIVINGVHEEQFRILMDFTKTLKLPLNRQNVLGILEAADYLQMEKARLLCCKFLERELHLSNCLGMMAYAWQLGCLELYAAARDVALTHLPAIASDEDFLYLSKESVADLLASDDLFIPQEDLAFEVTLRWATFDPANREDDFMELIGLVRPESLTLPYLTSLLTRLKGSDPRAKLICRLNDNIPASWTAGRSMPRGRSKESLFMIGGPHDVEAQPLYQFNPRSSRWQCCAPMKRKNLTQYSVAAVEDNMLVTGGYFRDIGWYSVDWVQIYRCTNGRWADGPALQKSRHSHCSVGVGNRLYVLGGSMDEGVVDSVEVLVLGSDAWVEVSPMVCAVERAAIVTMGSCIYVACGLDENGEVYSGIQRYQMKTDQWDVVVHCPHPRYDLLATELNGALYLFGGQALRLDLDTDEWTLLEEECLDRKFFTGCATTSGQIYLLGERRLRNIPNMVLFDPYIDTCIEIDDAIPCPVPIHGCVSIRMINY